MTSCCCTHPSSGASTVGRTFLTLTHGVPAMPMQALCTVCNAKPTVRLKCSLAVAVEVGSTHNGEQGRSISALAYALRRLRQSHPCPPCDVPGEIEIKPIEHNTVMRCQHCGETRQYLDSACFLTPLSIAGVAREVHRCSRGFRWPDCSREAGERGVQRDSE